MADIDSDINPPKFARLLLECIIPSQDRAVIMGDLYEGYCEKFGKSPIVAKRWYWQQTLKSMPYLAWRHLSSRHVKTMGGILLVTLLAFLFIKFWDVYAARGVVRYLSNADMIPLHRLRLIYFFLYMMGAALVGFLTMSILKSNQRPGTGNMWLCLGPIIAIIVADSTVRFLFADTPNALRYFIQRVGFSVPALIVGAIIGMHLTRGSDR